MILTRTWQKRRAYNMYNEDCAHAFKKNRVACAIMKQRLARQDFDLF